MAFEVSKPSVVIPAHNESSVIDRCLDTLASGVDAGWAEVIVVCNGCTDDTADRARSHAGVTVLDTPTGGKPGALNLGDEHATGFPRAYVDADVVVTGADLTRVFDEMSNGPAEAAAPGLDVDLAGVSRAVRLWYGIWMQLPYVTDELVGCGVFCLSEAGHSRVTPFPDLIADDEHVRLSFKPGERRSVPGTSFTIAPAQNIRTLVSVEARRRTGNVQMRDVGELATEDVDAAQGSAVKELARTPANWPGLAVFAGTRAAVQATMAWRRRRGRSLEWSRDLSSR